LSLYLAVLLLLGQLPLSLLQGLKAFTAGSVTACWGLFAPVSSVETAIDFMGFPMEVTLECTAIHYMTIYAAGVLAYSSHSFRYRLTGISIGLPAIFLLNILRIGIVGLVGYGKRDYVEFVHAYLWQGSFALIVFLFWILWIRDAAAASVLFSRRSLMVLATAFLAATVLSICMEWYAVVLATASNRIFRVLSFLSGSPLVAMPSGSAIGYVLPQGTIFTRISNDVMSAAIFYAIAAGSFFGASRHLLFKRTGAGTALLFLKDVLFVVLYGVLLERGIGDDVFNMILYSIVGLSFAAPLLIWLAVTAQYPDRGAAPQDREREPSS